MTNSNQRLDIPLSQLMIPREFVGVKEKLFPEMFPSPSKKLTEFDNKILELAYKVTVATNNIEKNKLIEDIRDLILVEELSKIGSDK